MACPDELGPFGTKRRCGIALCTCIVSDLIILILYWSRIGDALQNPFIAIIESLKNESNTTIHFLNNSLSRNTSNGNTYFEYRDTPTVGRMIYHFAGTVLYIGYTCMNIKILVNAIIKFYYMHHTIPTWNPLDYRVLQPFIFDCKGRMAKWYFLTVIVLHLIICMDDVLIRHAIGFKLPFNELCLEIIRQFTNLAFKAIGHVINSLFFVFFLLISAIIIMSMKMTVILMCTDDFFGDSRNFPLTRDDQATRRRLEGTEADNIASQARSVEESDRYSDTSSTQHAFVSPKVKIDDLPPSYEEGSLPPTYDEALVLESIEMIEIHPEIE